MSACDECRNDFDAMSRLVESLPDNMKTNNCVLNAKMLLVALAYQKAEKENAKLRELVRDMMRYYFMPSAIDSKQRETELLERAHELGVEKDNGELCVEVDA